MKKTELILVGLFLVALVLNFLRIPSAGILTILSYLILFLFYSFLSFALFNDIRFRNIGKKESYSNISALRMVGTITFGIILSIAITGIVFKFQLWPGAFQEMIIGLFGISIVSIVSLIKIAKDKTGFYKKILIRALIFGALITSLIATPTKTWLTWRYSNHPDYVNAVMEAKEHPENPELWKKVDEERKKMLKNEEN